MREFQEKHIFRKRLYSKTTICFLFLIIILMTKGALNVYAKEKMSRDELVRVQKEQSTLETRHAVLQENSDRLKTSSGIESEIRGKFDVAKPGEEVIVIVDKDVPQTEQDNRGVIKKIWDSIIGVFKKSPEHKQ